MKFLYVGAGKPYPFDRHIVDGLRDNGHEIDELSEDSEGFGKYRKLIKNLREAKKKGGAKYDAIFVGFACPLFVPVVRLCSGRGARVIFNAVSSQYEANIVSRDVRAWSVQALKWWLVDFVSFRLSWKVLLESEAQADYVRRLWFIPRRKAVKAWSGLNEKDFFYEAGLPKRDKFTVLFRGRFLPESGIDTVIKAAKILENSDIEFVVVGHGFWYKEVNRLRQELSPKNATFLTKPLPIADLRRLMQSCRLSLGQMADHPRLDRTLPCKLFESLAMRLPYLTARNPAVLELLKENETCFCSEPGDPEDLAAKILHLRDRPEELDRVADNGYRLYKDKLTSKRLADEIIKSCFETAATP